VILRVLLLAIPATFFVHWLAGDRTTVLSFCSMVAMIPASLTSRSPLTRSPRIADRACAGLSESSGRLGDARRDRSGSQSDFHGHHSDGHDRQRLEVGQALFGVLISDGQSHWMKGVQLLALFAVLTSVIMVLT
jgi:hypothetical protein